MIFCPLPGKPIVSQWYGSNPAHYAQYGQAGHNGIDFAVPVGTKVYAPHEGIIKIKKTAGGYGRHITITSLPYKDNTRRVSTLAHLSSSLNLFDGQFVSARDVVALSGGAKGTDGAGDSSGPHLHWDYALEDSYGNRLNKKNGYNGALNLCPVVSGIRSSSVQLWEAEALLR